MRSYHTQAGEHISVNVSRRWPGHHTRIITTACLLIQQQSMEKDISANIHIETNSSRILLVLYITLQQQTQWGKRISSIPISTVEVRDRLFCVLALNAISFFLCELEMNHVIPLTVSLIKTQVVTHVRQLAAISQRAETVLFILMVTGNVLLNYFPIKYVMNGYISFTE